MNIPDRVYSIFTAEIESGSNPIISVPKQEIEVGDLTVGENYRIAILPPVDGAAQSKERRSESQPELPVETDEVLEVEIEDIGEKGDGIARIGPGYVVFVPNTAVGDRVAIKITEARENFGFGEIIEGEPLSN